MIAFFKIIRWPNLLIIALVQYLIRFFIIESLGVPHVLNHLEFFLWVLCSISLAAAGYIINDIHDVDADKANKPQRIVIDNGISLNGAWGAYSVLNVVGIICGYVVAEAAGLSSLWLLPVVVIALLYLYAIDLKKRALLGNLLVSLLTALPVFLVGVFDVLPAANANTADLIKPVFYVISAYAGFAFFTNLVREIIKDAEDVEGDDQEGYRTLAVVMGRTSIRYVIVLLLVVMLCFTGAFNAFLFQSDLISSIYLLIFVNLPILYLIFKVLRSNTKVDFKQASTLTKIIMLTGILSMVVFTLSITSGF